ncbi:MAG: TPM domain-containing protein [Clostridia bacterium]|nr:TPM domain-containing protein [Clostridia bacterium]
MKKKLLFAVLLLFTLLMTYSVAYAKENEWVLDEPQVLTQETKDYIENLNENVFVNYKNKPQLGIMVINQLPSGYTIDEYTFEKFNEYGVGTEKEDCGLLFVFAIEDREYGLEIGDGFVEGSLLCEELEKDFITSDMKSLLREEKYDTVVLEVVKHLETMMADEENGVYLEREQAKKEQEQLQRERTDKFFNTLFHIIMIICPPLLVGFIAYKLVKRYLKRKKIRRFLEQKDKLISFCKIDKEVLYSYLIDKTKSSEEKELDSELLQYLYQYYRQYVYGILSQRQLENSIEKYRAYFDEENSVENFHHFMIKDVDTIIYEVDQKIAHEKEVERKNEVAIEDFVNKNSSRVNQNLSTSTLKSRIKNYCKQDILITESELEEAFCRELHKLNFEYEYNAFIKENEDSIDTRYFDSSEFYHILQNSGEYADYKRHHDHSWMLPLLFMHMENRKSEIKRREKEAADRRARMARQSSHSSSFGSGFGGGHSSSHRGFSGKW